VPAAILRDGHAQ